MSPGAAMNRPDLRQAWRGPALLVLDTAGAAGDLPLTGFYFRETRFLSTLRLLINGELPEPCSISGDDPGSIEATYIYPEVRRRGGGGSGSGGDHRHLGVLARGVDLDVRYRVRPASLRAESRITARWDDDITIEVGWSLAADYAGVLEVLADPAIRLPSDAMPIPDGARFRTGRALPLETIIEASGGDGVWSFSDGRLSTRVRLRRQSTVILTLEVRAFDGGDPVTRADEARRESVLFDHIAALPTVTSASDPSLVRACDGAIRDLASAALLDGPEDEWLYPAAGFPLYPGAFGRDAATASWQSAAFDHGALARASGALLARTQGARADATRDERPGRIIQQARKDPRSRLGEVPFARYYGDVASPFMYVISIGNAYAWTGDRTLIARHWAAMERVIDWARRDGDLRGDGYIAYRTESPDGPMHQGWKDSDNAVVDQDGRWVGAPFTPCEIQGYFFAALQFMAGMSLVRGDRRGAIALWREATSLKERFNADFWLSDDGFIAFGLDPDGCPLRVLTSNAAQCIATGIVASEHLPRLVRRIFEPDLFSGWGIRTLSTENPAYNPLDYHLGTVWPVENASVLFGLRRFGYDEQAMRLAEALHDLARAWAGGRAPECVGGYPRAGRSHPGAYPQANPFQTWNQSVYPLMLQTLLGAWPLVPLRTLAIDPILPADVADLTIRDWRVGDATVSVRFSRAEDGNVEHEVLDTRGDLRIVRQPAPESQRLGIGGRAARLLAEQLSTR